MLSKSFAITGLFAAFAFGSIVPRAIVSSGGTIVSPTSGSDATAGQSIPFHYFDRNKCESGYSLITVYLLDAAPTTLDVTDSGTFTNFVFSFGNFLIPNFGLPPMTSPTPPPPTLTIPDLGPSVPDGELFFSIIETFRDCPPDGHIEFGLSSTPIEYHAV
ncbi:hypothetical protein QCA50_001328 [Cerrena zonata]|uniref:Uncharacterized protein n=1 Tax=Cerrena zonata TaxID=2478898 RepID=A0AAW0GLB9_9APHY